MKCLWLCIAGLFMATAQSSEQELAIVQKPIQMNATRDTLTLDYLQQRYGIKQNEPTITPTMVVVHWTVIPTLEQTFDVFDPVELPAARDGIHFQVVFALIRYVVYRIGCWLAIFSHIAA